MTPLEERLDWLMFAYIAGLLFDGCEGNINAVHDHGCETPPSVLNPPGS